MAARRELRELRLEPPGCVEELPGLVALHPALEDAYVFRLVHVGHRHLMRAPVAFALQTVDLLRAGPTLGRAEHDHGPRRSLRDALRPRVELDLLDVGDDRIQRAGELLMHALRLVAYDEMRLVAVALE